MTDTREAKSEDQARPTPEEQVRALYEQAESRTAKAAEQLVMGDAFGELLARTTENVIALTRIGSDVADLVLRNLRIAGRTDVARLGRALARTDDKLERVLQEVEALRDELATRAQADPKGNGVSRTDAP
jgi:hypothetical protein